MSTSRYPSLLARYLSIATTKKGTAYEVLTGMVCKTLQERNVVIHDVRLLGESEVKHQIDIKVQDRDGIRTLLIECKDFDKSETNVGLGIVRNFESAVADIKPDQAWIVTCVGFTEDALKYAKKKDIKPVVMRIFEDRDLDGRIKRIVLNFHVRTPTNPTAALYVDEEQYAVLELAKCAANIGEGIALNDDAYFVSPDGTQHHFNEKIMAVMNDAMDKRAEGEARCIIKPGADILMIGGMDVPFQGIVVDFGILTETETRDIVSSRIAELIVQGVGNADIIIFDDQLRRRSIDRDTGEIA